MVSNDCMHAVDADHFHMKHDVGFLMAMRFHAEILITHHTCNDDTRSIDDAKISLKIKLTHFSSRAVAEGARLLPRRWKTRG